jgi:hypothetical protein
MHREVDGDCVTLFEAEGFKDVGYFTDFTEEFAIGDFFSFGGFVCFVDDGCL